MSVFFSKCIYLVSQVFKESNISVQKEVTVHSEKVIISACIKFSLCHRTFYIFCKKEKKYFF